MISTIAEKKISDLLKELELTIKSCKTEREKRKYEILYDYLINSIILNDLSLARRKADDKNKISIKFKVIRNIRSYKNN
jgi:hypothetical protein